MTPELLSYYLRGLECLARIEGMKAENTHREQCGNPIAYGDEAFGREADELMRLANLAINAAPAAHT